MKNVFVVKQKRSSSARIYMLIMAFLMIAGVLVVVISFFPDSEITNETRLIAGASPFVLGLLLIYMLRAGKKPLLVFSADGIAVFGFTAGAQIASLKPIYWREITKIYHAVETWPGRVGVSELIHIQGENGVDIIKVNLDAADYNAVEILEKTASFAKAYNPNVQVERLSPIAREQITSEKRNETYRRLVRPAIIAVILLLAMRACGIEELPF